VTRPTPSVEPSARPVPTATPEPDTGPLVFKQPLTAGCATDDAVWVVSDGGGIGRFDRLLLHWELVDSTLRSLVAAACGPDTVTAVGAFGRVVLIDDLAKTIHADDLGVFSAYAVSLLPDGALVVGSEGSVQRQRSVGWGQVTYVVGDGGTALAVEGNTVRPIANLITTCALRGVFARGNEVWFVGSEGTLAGVWRQSGDRIDHWGTC